MPDASKQVQKTIMHACRLTGKRGGCFPAFLWLSATKKRKAPSKTIHFVFLTTLDASFFFPPLNVHPYIPRLNKYAIDYFLTLSIVFTPFYNYRRLTIHNEGGSHLVFHREAPLHRSRCICSSFTSLITWTHNINQWIAWVYCA